MGDNHWEELAMWPFLLPLAITLDMLSAQTRQSRAIERRRQFRVIQGGKQ